MVLSGVSPVAPTHLATGHLGRELGTSCLSGPQPWRMLASNYVHIGLIHIFFNMWCLWNLGRLAERIFGRWTYLLVYTASGIGGSLASLWWHPRGIGAGASGAIFGLAGGLIAVLYLGKLPISKDALKPTLKSLITVRGLQLVFRAGAGHRQRRPSWWPGNGSRARRRPGRKLFGTPGKSRALAQLCRGGNGTAPAGWIQLRQAEGWATIGS